MIMICDPFRYLKTLRAHVFISMYVCICRPNPPILATLRPSATLLLVFVVVDVVL